MGTLFLVSTFIFIFGTFIEVLVIDYILKHNCETY